MTVAAVRVDAGRVTTITMSRPEVLNAGDRALLTELLAAIEDAGSDPSARVLVLTGAGRGFCAGADLSAGAWAPGELPMGEAVGWILEHGWNPIVRALLACPKPTIAAVNGVAAGGGVGLALACDVVVAAESASFVEVFGPQLAAIPDVGSTWFLTHLVGPARARGMSLLGERIPARQAAEWGLIWKAVPDIRLVDEVGRVAERLARLDPHIAPAIRAALSEAGTATLDETLDRERDIQRRLAGRPAFAEGVAAFLEKRPPRFH